ncbi:Glutamine--fructose-6-phosphate aminotransferase [isomerizing] [Polaromonas vacuolata]|uniref:Glutamine--fructose-6-phosphate aminotransferase [isomerizing] n=1 Tax=Polaromonas vacuolata TaxID=37448 RepID=A0A6H2H8K3_9BURK|nr:SIS domain-containing protein [Polaromonas vacuolata]QJC55924.1 Glutamine--fructose-6-phosphate aminotransferase [isomerizing] [Polaromonas vacuolata]
MNQTHMLREILEIPAMLRREAGNWQAQAKEIQTLRSNRPNVTLLGRGSSGNACTFGSYLFTLQTGRQPVEFRPWLTTQALPDADWSDNVAMAFSASGHSTDVTEALRWLKQRGALTVAVTGADGASPLADLADKVFRLRCGPELAVPATKSFVAQLFAVAALANYPVIEAAEQTATAMESLLKSDTVDKLATFLHGAQTTAWVARGPSYAGALDAALKTQESLGKTTVAYSSAEFLHGPIAMFHPQDRVVIFSDADETMASKQAVVTTLLARKVPFITIGSDATHEAGLPLELPKQRWARTAILAILSELVCEELAKRMGLDADAPADLNKVTLTM